MADSASSQPEELSASEPTTSDHVTPEEPPIAEETPLPASPSPFPTSPPPADQKKRIPPVAIVIGGGLLIIALIILIISLAIRSFILPDEPPGIPLEVTRVSQSPLVTPSAPPADAPVAEVGDTRVALPTPIRLDVGSATFFVQAAASTGISPWPATFPPDTAIWAPDTVLNYVLGLEAIPENETLLEGLRQEDPILLTLSNGTRLTFRMNERRDVAAHAEAIYSQSRLQLTLVLPQEGETWTIVVADFEAAIEPTPVPAGATATVGQAVQVGDAQVTVNAGHIQPNASVPQAGTEIYIVEFSVVNTGATPLDPELFSMELQDNVGNIYLLSRSASETGANGLLTSLIQPGAEATGSAGYLIPDNLVSSGLSWIFKPTPAAELRAVFSVPYTPETTAPPIPDIYVYEAFLDPDEEALHILADVYNDGGGPFTVTENDITLSCNSGPGELITAAPPLPWITEGGDGREVELTFNRPQELPCVVTIYGFTFEISE